MIPALLIFRFIDREPGPFNGKAPACPPRNNTADKEVIIIILAAGHCDLAESLIGSDALNGLRVHTLIETGYLILLAVK